VVSHRMGEIYYLELLRASEGTSSRWSRIHLQSLAPIPVSRRVDVRQAAGRKIIVESLSQHDEKHVIPTPLSEIRVGRKRLRWRPEKISTLFYNKTIYNSSPVITANKVC
jgi:hypothetical protein